MLADRQRHVLRLAIKLVQLFNDDKAPVYSAFLPCGRQNLFKRAIAL